MTINASRRVCLEAFLYGKSSDSQLISSNRCNQPKSFEYFINHSRNSNLSKTKTMSPITVERTPDSNKKLTSCIAGQLFIDRFFEFVAEGQPLILVCERSHRG